MPIIKSAKKAARQAEKRTAHNQQIKKDIKAALKAFKKNPTMETLAKAQSEFDKAVKKDLMKKNTAARRKAALYKLAVKNGLKLAKVEAKETVKKVEKKVAEVEKKAEKKVTEAKKTVAKKTESKAKATKK